MATSCTEALGTSPVQPSFVVEQAHRLLIFAHNLAQAQRLQEEDLGTAEFGVTMFSDLTGTTGGRAGEQGLLQGLRYTFHFRG